jgi:hypothetical protein
MDRILLLLDVFGTVWNIVIVIFALIFSYVRLQASFVGVLIRTTFAGKVFLFEMNHSVVARQVAHKKGTVIALVAMVN